MTIAQYAYELYKLDWCLRRCSHCRAEAIRDIAVSDPDGSRYSTIEEGYQEQGILGSLYLSFEEFLADLYTDAEYIEELLGRKELVDKYRKDVMQT